MDFINGWSEGKVELKDLNGLNAVHFLSNDFIINEAYIDKSAKIISNWVYKGLDIGMIMKYNWDIGFILFTLNGAYASLSLIVNYDNTFYGKVIKGTQCNIPIDSEVKIAIELTDLTYQFYVNDKLLFKTTIEDTAYRVGRAGLYSHAGNYCTEFSIYSEVPSLWEFDEPIDKWIEV